jgi:hypothetical protein
MKELKDLKKAIVVKGYSISKDEYDRIAEEEDLMPSTTIAQNYGWDKAKKIVLDEVLSNLPEAYEEKTFCLECNEYDNCHKMLEECEYKKWIDDYFAGKICMEGV